MKSDYLEVCSHCRRSLTVRFRDFEDVGFYFHWDGDYYCIDVVLFVEGSRLLFVLYREVYVAESKKKEVKVV
jgi:hypothetical protein